MKTRVDVLNSAAGFIGGLVNLIVRKAKVRGLKPEHIHLLVTDDARADALGDRMAEQMVAVLEAELLLEEVRALWTRFYQEVLGMTVDLSGVIVPAAIAGKNEILFMARGLSYAKVLEICRKRFATYLYYDDLQAAIDPAKEERHPDKNGSYAIRHGGHVEATEGDHELKELNVEQIRDGGFKTMAELERMIFELFYEFTHPGEHLDRRDVTLSSGSRFRGGYVPNAYWRDGFRVRWCHVQGSDSLLRARSVVSVV